MLPDQQDTVRQFFELLIWDQPFKAEAAVADVLTEEAPDLPTALRHAMGDLAPSADWNQLGFLLEYLKEMAAGRGILSDLDDADEDNFDLDEPDDFFAKIQALLVDFGYDLWQWETGDDTFCAVIARTDDRSALEVLTRKLGLTAGHGALVCAAYL